ncbi:MAG: hypothetical protein AB8G95_06705 [Anaerolineae bacterium]
MNFAKRVFQAAAVWGFLVITPLFFFEEQMSANGPMLYPENYYGFLAVTFAWQACFYVISRDPVRFRPLMIPAMLEKFPIIVIYTVLWQQGRLAAPALVFGVIDLIFGVLFLAAYLRTDNAPSWNVVHQ